MAPQLILIKHAMPEIQPERPHNTWSLSEAGRRSCTLLAERVKGYTPRYLFTSKEPKAFETAEQVGAALGLTVETLEGVHEHDRTGEPFTSDDLFRAQVAGFFANPARLMFGRETAGAVYLRFSAGIDRIVAAHPGETLAVVSHGTAMALFTARKNKHEPLSLWMRLGLPSLIVLSLPDYGLVEVVEEIV